MVSFFFKQSAEAVSAHRIRLLLALVPVLIYLTYCAVTPDRFVISQTISISKNSLVTFSPKPNDLKAVSELAANPSDFFLNNFAVLLLARQLDNTVGLSKANDRPPDLRTLIFESMSLTAKNADASVITYTGKDPKMGEKMVAFYSQRLIQRAQDWLAQNRGNNRDGAPAPKLTGELTVEAKRAPWRGNRLLPSLYILLVSLFATIMIISLLNWFTPSFRSERHMAGYLSVPILGSLPNLNRLEARMNISTRSGRQVDG